MNLYINSEWHKDHRIIAHEKDNTYRVHKLLYINNTTNFHGTEPTDELISLSDEEFKSFKKIVTKRSMNSELFNIDTIKIIGDK